MNKKIDRRGKKHNHTKLLNYERRGGTSCPCSIVFTQREIQLSAVLQVGRDSPQREYSSKEMK